MCLGSTGLCRRAGTLLSRRRQLLASPSAFLDSQQNIISGGRFGGHAVESSSSSPQFSAAAAPCQCSSGLRFFSDDSQLSGGAIAADSEGGQPGEQSAPGRRAGEGRDMMMVFTCTVCDTRAAKTMSRQSYEKGVVLVKCPGCQNLHLIADRYGWFGEPGSIEDYLAERGEEVFRGSDDGTLELTPEQLAGWSKKSADEGKGNDGTAVDTKWLGK